MVLVVDCYERDGKRLWRIHDGTTFGPGNSREVTDCDMAGPWDGDPTRFVAEIHVPLRDDGPES